MDNFLKARTTQREQAPESQAIIQYGSLNMTLFLWFLCICKFEYALNPYWNYKAPSQCAEGSSGGHSPCCLLCSCALVAYRGIQVCATAPLCHALMFWRGGLGTWTHGCISRV